MYFQLETSRFAPENDRKFEKFCDGALHLTLLPYIEQYSVFGSILTFGAMIGAITGGPIADFIGRKWVSTKQCKLTFGFGNYSCYFFCCVTICKNVKYVQTMRMASGFCVAGWLAIYFAEVSLTESRCICCKFSFHFPQQ